MKPEKITVLFFSPTGGTEKVARLIGESLGQTAVCCDMTVKNADVLSFTENDLAVFCVPVYGGRVPTPVKERLSRVSGSGTNAALTAVFGNRAVDDALLELRDMVRERGFRTIAAAEFVAPHSIDPVYGAGRPDEADKKVIAEFAGRLLEKAASESPAEITVPGKSPYVKYNGIPLKPVVSAVKCIRCGACAANCPAGAIDFINPRLTDKATCISCMRCIQVCPKGARHIPAPMKAAVSKALKKLCAGRKEPKTYF
jgi:ferredoxin